MIKDVGDAVLLSVTIRDLSGTPVNTPTVVATVTKPDLTTSSPTVTNTSAGGIYTTTFTADQAGLWRITWTASGTVTSVDTDQFTANAAGRVLVASFDEFKARINRGDVTDDAELRTYLVSATDWAEWAIGGPLSVQTFTEIHWVSSGTIVPRKRPIVSVTSITPDQGTALSSSSYFINPDTATIEFRYGVLSNWHTLVYTAGLGPTAIVTRERVKLAGLEVAAHLWTGQNGSAGRGFPPEDAMPTPFGFAVPRRAFELLEPDRIPGIG